MARNQGVPCVHDPDQRPGEVIVRVPHRFEKPAVQGKFRALQDLIASHHDHSSFMDGLRSWKKLQDFSGKAPTCAFES
jgi:hypothetical protein